MGCGNAPLPPGVQLTGARSCSSDREQRLLSPATACTATCDDRRTFRRRSHFTASRRAGERRVVLQTGGNEVQDAVGPWRQKDPKACSLGIPKTGARSCSSDREQRLLSPATACTATCDDRRTFRRRSHFTASRRAGERRVVLQTGGNEVQDAVGPWRQKDPKACSLGIPKTVLAPSDSVSRRRGPHLCGCEAERLHLNRSCEWHMILSCSQGAACARAVASGRRQFASDRQ